MSKKDKIKTIEVDDVNLVPELLDGNHRVIPIVTGGDEPVEEVEVPEIIPILTLRSSVLFPGAITPITVGRDKSINLVRAVNAEGGILGAVLQRESDVEDPAPDDMYKVGTAARIIKILEMPNGNLTVILNGLEKVEITEYITTEPYFKARVTALHDSTPDVKSIEFEAFVDSIRDVALNIINVSPSMPKEAAFAIKNIDSKRGIINFICSNMELTDEDRQSLLEAPGLLARARKLLEILIREQQLAELKNQIQERVKQEIDKQQRDYYLQQQMRTIQDELGDGADADIEKMREEAKKKNWPAEVGETFEKELQKVERLNPAVAEYSVQMTYLQLLLELPWNDVTKDNLDLKCARAKQIAFDEAFAPEISMKDVEKILGMPKFLKEEYEVGGMTGVVTGLAWTEVGGDILYIESVLTPGKGKVSLTGNLGDVMKESATIAHEWTMAHYKELGIDPKLFETNDINIHVPEGAIPKDGPSAGITMVTSIVSSYTGRKVKERIAMTGETTLRGRVMPVGGVKEKILAAKRAGITELILSEENRKDIAEIKPEYIAGLTFHYVKTNEEVLQLALE